VGPGPYGTIKRNEILHQLSEEERSEYERLYARDDLSAAQKARKQALWDQASQANRRRQAEPLTAENDLQTYADEVAQRMQARANAARESVGPTQP
jgi:hypothetical protein